METKSKHTPGPCQGERPCLERIDGKIVHCRLHAAAPELLASLQRLVTQMEDEGGWEGYSLNEARAAIAKARGTDP